MILVLPAQTEAEARTELVAIREAGRTIVASPRRRREFLASLGFGDAKEAGTESKRAVPKSGKRGA